MDINDSIYGSSLEYGEFNPESYSSNYAPVISRFIRQFSDRNNVFISNCILRGQAVIDYHWIIYSERGEWLNQSGHYLNSISFTWPNSGGRFTVQLTVTDSVYNESFFSDTYDIPKKESEDIGNVSCSIPVYEQHGFYDIKKKIKKIKIVNVSSSNDLIKIKVLSIKESNRNKSYIFFKDMEQRSNNNVHI